MLPIVLDPALVEEAVLLTMRGHHDAARFHRERDTLYLLPAAERDARFGALHARWFERLQLGTPIAIALAELPILAETCVRTFVTQPVGGHAEGADLLVDEDGATPLRTVLIRVRPHSMGKPAELLAQLRVELLHVADMVDPAFGYEPTLPVSAVEGSHEQLLRDRYRVVWQTSIAGRLSAHDAELSVRARLAFRACFSMLGDHADEMFDHFSTTWPLTHAIIVAFCANPRAGEKSRLLGPGGRCPLCRLPTYAPEPTPDALPAAVLTLIAADFPSWEPAKGLCRQCADLYRARASSALCERNSEMQQLMVGGELGLTSS